MNFRPGELSAPDAMRLNEMFRELQRWRNLSVAYPLTLNRGSGSVSISATAMQVGFPAELTETWDSTIGYTAKRLLMSSIELIDAASPQEYIRVIAVDGDETLTVGTRGWLEPDPRRAGYIFIVPTPAPPGADSAWKTPSVRCATTAALPACTYANGSSGVGATLTGNANGALSAQDGVTLALNDPILVKDEASQSHNMIGTLTQVGSAGAPFIITRRTDADTAAKLLGATVVVTEGTLNADKIYLCTANATITVGTTALPWKDISGDVRGPSSATDNAVARYDGTTGKLIQNSVVTIDDSGNTIIPGTLEVGSDVTIKDGTIAGDAQLLFAPDGTPDPLTILARGNALATYLWRVAGYLADADGTDQIQAGLDVSNTAPGGHADTTKRPFFFFSGSVGAALIATRYDCHVGPGSYAQGVGGTLAPGAQFAGGICYSVGSGSFYTSGGTDVAVADGGTGASNASDARTNLGLVIGTDVQAYSADLDAVTGTNTGDQDLSGYVLTSSIGSAVQAYSARLDTLAAGTASAVTDLTDSTGGTAGGTVNDVTGAFDQTILNDNFASILAKLAELTAALQTAGVIT